MLWFLTLGFLLGIFPGFHCNNITDGEDVENAFLKDIIFTFKLLSPSIIFQEAAPDACMTGKWMLCLSNFQSSSIDALAEHLITVHNNSKQDGVIFLENELNKGLLEQLEALAPSIFRSNSPVFMPKEFVDLIKLRLDSNVIFYEREATNKFNLFDIFSVKGGPLITLDLGKWDFERVENGIMMKESIGQWDRRTDLKGAEFINAVHFNGVAARLIYEEIGEYDLCNTPKLCHVFCKHIFHTYTRLNAPSLQCPFI